MDIGIALLHSLGAEPKAIQQIAETAEVGGFHSLWVSEHILVPAQLDSKYPYTVTGKPRFDRDTKWGEAMVTLGFVAGLTGSIRLGTNVIAMTSLYPFSLAKQAATVDVLSRVDWSSVSELAGCERKRGRSDIRQII